ncbi:hypothetical protein NLM33_07360 [Bradyrhizobium sp. CCGUVB1N3]|uniref:hypothetical protein n=1 Tax=Bradyrhizobium sp. CCGUVB1N3 TaxID=2949629 RepID=UPI0020B1C125|nr:hypothetical protein [Bradyrhizobium sp. CCGUVB1N3]MCP3470143.1 hypothetical protein [Bradyrhizobium sp. CCGUVB1N3]
MLANEPSFSIWRWPAFVLPQSIRAVAAVSSWTGFYAGAAIGWAGYRDDWTTDLIANGAALGTPAAIGRLGLGGPNANFDTDGFRGSLFAGYNYQINPSVVAGIEGR